MWVGERSGVSIGERGVDDGVERRSGDVRARVRGGRPERSKDGRDGGARRRRASVFHDVRGGVEINGVSVFSVFGVLVVLRVGGAECSGCFVLHARYKILRASFDEGRARSRPSRLVKIDRVL